MELNYVLIATILTSLASITFANVIVQPGYGQPGQQFSSYMYRDAAEPASEVKVIHHYVQESDLNRENERLVSRSSVGDPRYHYTRHGGLTYIRPTTTIVGSPYNPDVAHYRYRRSALPDESLPGLANDVAEKSSIIKTIAHVDSQKEKARPARNHEGSELLGIFPKFSSPYPGYQQIQPFASTNTPNAESSVQPEAKSSSHSQNVASPQSLEHSSDKDAMKFEGKSSSGSIQQNFPPWWRTSSQSLEDTSRKSSQVIPHWYHIGTSMSSEDSSRKSSQVGADSARSSEDSNKTIKEIARSSSVLDNNTDASQKLTQTERIADNEATDKHAQLDQAIVDLVEKSIQSDQEGYQNANQIISTAAAARPNEEQAIIYVTSEPNNQLYAESLPWNQILTPNYYTAPIVYSYVQNNPLSRNYPDPRPIGKIHSSEIMTIHHDGSNIQDSSKIIPATVPRSSIGYDTTSLLSGYKPYSFPTYTSFQNYQSYPNSYSYLSGDNPTYVVLDNDSGYENFESNNMRQTFKHHHAPHYHGTQPFSPSYQSHHLPSHSSSAYASSSNHGSSSSASASANTSSNYHAKPYLSDSEPSTVYQSPAYYPSYSHTYNPSYTPSSYSPTYSPSYGSY